MRQRYSVIAAIDVAGGYAKNGKIPWYYSEDFKWFRKQTTGHICVMGRNTYEDINARLGDKAKESVLPNRQCFVLSTTLTDLPNATVVRTLSEVEKFSPDTNIPIFIIGGGALFNMGVLLADTVVLTEINSDYNCDKFFPLSYLTDHFIIRQQIETDDKELCFYTFERIQNDTTRKSE
ncbi:MAG: hypothetical protein CTY12_01485 [Methylotenera sp.]|nr:MAG: hypothetical protein CTY12_01485 [Methylotenera sp.]